MRVVYDVFLVYVVCIVCVVCVVCDCVTVLYACCVRDMCGMCGV
jgi:hypothetical protein